jgi:hypothetical protein
VAKGARQERVALARYRRVRPHGPHRPRQPWDPPADEDERIDADGGAGETLGLARVEPVLSDGDVAMKDRVGKAGREARERLLQATDRVLQVLREGGCASARLSSALGQSRPPSRRRTFISASRFASIISFCVGALLRQNEPAPSFSAHSAVSLLVIVAAAT